MSGIVGMLALRGAPCDPTWLQTATALLAQQGPDAQRIWHQQHIGFGHALLRTTHEAAAEEQPCTLDDRLWITADVRLDNRAGLRTRLQEHGQQLPPQAPDPVLLLHAYRVWGERCVEHLLGDFAFLIWDQPRQRLFCARDHLGIKSLYYAAGTDYMLFSNTLACLQRHATVSHTLNEQAIGDFLLCGYNQCPETTIFADIRCLPPAHVMTWEGGRWSSRCYWRLADVIDVIRYRRDEDYVEAFRERLGTAVWDRVRTHAVGVCMSGGVDSTALAALACAGAADHGQAVDVQAYTIVYKRLFADLEWPYAQAAARAFQIPIHDLEADAYPLLGGDYNVPQPEHIALFPNKDVILRKAAAHSRVVLHGHGGDEILTPSSTYVTSMLGRGQITRVLGELVAAWRTHGVRPPLGLRRVFTRERQRRTLLAAYPPWLNEDFARRHHLRERWQAHIWSLTTPCHPLRPEAHMLLSRPIWPVIFAGHDPGVTRVPIEVRYPFLDLRVMSFALSVPPLVWCMRKRLLRMAMCGIVPALVLQRPKQGLGGDPVVASLQQETSRWVDTFTPCTMLDMYVKRSCIPSLYNTRDSAAAWLHLRPLRLDLWLRHQHI